MFFFGAVVVLLYSFIVIFIVVSVFVIVFFWVGVVVFVSVPYCSNAFFVNVVVYAIFIFN